MADQEEWGPAWEKAARDRLQDLASAGERPLRSADWVRRTHRRRRTIRATAAAVSCAAVITVGLTLAGPDGFDRGLPADPATVTPTPAVTTTPEETETSTPDETATTTPAPTSSPTSTAPQVPTTIPAEVRLPSEGEDGWTETSSWQHSPCPGVEVSLDAASDSRTIEISGVEYAYSETLAVFPDAQAAVAFMAGLEQGAQSCGTGDSSGMVVPVGVAPLQGRWGQGLLIWVSQRMDETTDENPLYAVGNYLAAARNGNAVVLSLDLSHHDYRAEPKPSPAAVDAAREPLDKLAPELCRFTEAGC